MTEVVEQQATQVEQPEAQVAPNATQAMAESLWNLQPTVYQSVQNAPTEQQKPVVEQPKPEEQPPQVTQTDTPEVLELDDYFQRSFGMNATDFKTKWEELNKPQDPPQPQEVRWTYDDSKEDEIYDYIHRKKQLDRLEKLEISDATHAAEIIRTNLQYKYKDLKPEDIDRLFARQYTMPAKPQQSIDQTDEDYAAAVSAWEAQVKDKQQDMILDAKLAKPELLQYKSQIVQPQIQKPEVQQQGPSQEDLAKVEAGRQAYLGAIESSYQNFKGYSVTAKNGDVQLPISYNISPEELMATKTTIEDFNVDGFFGQRWFENNTPRVNLIQEDLYLLQNRDKIFQKIANEAAAQMQEHLIKVQNNIKLHGVNGTLTPGAPISSDTPKSESEQLAAKLWAM